MNQAAEIFNFVWTLLEKPDRTPRETELMIHAAHASRFLWEEEGTAVNHARGEWQVSRAYAVAGRPGPALHHAALCLEIAEAEELAPFDLACAHEAIARAFLIAGDTERARDHELQARALAHRITDEDERGVGLPDLATPAVQ